MDRRYSFNNHYSDIPEMVQWNQCI
jgi:hypothetical protein